MIEGSLEGQICVEAGSEVRWCWSWQGAKLFNETEPALYVGNAGQTILVLKDGTQNRIQSGAGKESGEAEPEEEASMGVVYARDDLAVTGDGSLTVHGLSQQRDTYNQ